MAMKLLTVGELARRVEVPPDTVRYYEQRGLVEPEERSSSGYRLYGTDSIRRLKFIVQAKLLGFTLKEIKSLLEAQVTTHATCRDISQRATAKLDSIKSQKRELVRINEVLTELISACPADDTPIHECPILEYLYPEESV